MCAGYTTTACLLYTSYRAVDDILHGGFKNGQIVEGFLAEFDVFRADLLGRFDEDVYKRQPIGPGSLSL